MKILQTVVVKQILTEKSRQNLLEQYHSRILQLKKEIEQLRFEWKKLEKSKKFQPESIKKHFEKEMNLRQEKERLLEFQISQLHMLPLESELKEKEVQALVEVNIGDAWDTIESGKTIIIRDGIVEDIR
ncbi:YlqD family protein [Neobacillus terrae]|uniref:YlqD family protein n=1 Tax=Neobacillus terrae TaxID=3034837 RepID=UPI00140862A6|nr:YlqD family protein [Neobacillus terrae]NHM29770.1 hypothetical protein [Neobacillus terrae]